MCYKDVYYCRANGSKPSPCRRSTGHTARGIACSDEPPPEELDDGEKFSPESCFEEAMEPTNYNKARARDDSFNMRPIHNHKAHTGRSGLWTNAFSATFARRLANTCPCSSGRDGAKACCCLTRACLPLAHIECSAPDLIAHTDWDGHQGFQDFAIRKQAIACSVCCGCTRRGAQLAL